MPISIVRWTDYPTAFIYKNATPGENTAYTVKAAKNEHNGFQVGLKSPSAVTGVTLSMGNLTGTGGTILASNVKLKLLQYHTLADFANLEHPDAVMDYTGAFNLSANVAQPVYVDIYVPKTTTAGDYTGTLTISVTGEGETTVTVNLHVYNFQIPDTPAIGSTMNLWNGVEIAGQHQQTEGSAENKVTYENYLDTMLDYGFSSFRIPDWYSHYSAEGAAYLQDPRLTLCAIPYSATEQDMIDLAARYTSLGCWEKMYDYTEDEPTTMAQYAAIKTRCNYLHGVDSRYKTMVTLADMCQQSTEPTWTTSTSYAVGDLVGHNSQEMYFVAHVFRCKQAHTSGASSEPAVGGSWTTYWDKVDPLVELAGYVDIYAIGTMQWSVYASRVPTRIAAGDTIWFYDEWGIARIDENPDRIQPGVETRNRSWLGYWYGCEGMLQWRIDWWSGCPDPWTTTKNCPWGYAQGMSFYPGYQKSINGMVASKRFELMRISLADFHYMKAAEARSSRQAVLDIIDPLLTDWYNYSTDPAAYETARNSIAEIAEAPYLSSISESLSITATAQGNTAMNFHWVRVVLLSGVTFEIPVEGVTPDDARLAFSYRQANGNVQSLLLTVNNWVEVGGGVYLVGIPVPIANGLLEYVCTFTGAIPWPGSQRIIPVSQGVGLVMWNYTVTSGGLPLEGVSVWISTDQAGNNVVAGPTLTDHTGTVTFGLDPGTYYVWCKLRGYRFSNPDMEVVS